MDERQRWPFSEQRLHHDLDAHLGHGICTRVVLKDGSETAGATPLSFRSAPQKLRGCSTQIPGETTYFEVLRHHSAYMMAVVVVGCPLSGRATIFIHSTENKRAVRLAE